MENFDDFDESSPSNLQNILNNIDNDEISKAKINKPDELKDFNAYPHFTYNITNYTKNCLDPITEYSYYCFTCKHSVCSECGVFEHKDHLLIQRDNCLKYDNTFFNEIHKVIEDSFEIEDKKEIIKQSITTIIEKIKRKLDDIKKMKFKEIDKLFKDIQNNLIEIKRNYEIVKENIEEYYLQNENFFNIIKGNNNDIENTIFIMNFELMNLCDNKNLDVLDSINSIKNKITEYNNAISFKSDSISNEIEHMFDNDSTIETFDDFYWDVKVRVNKYNEHINKFKSSVFDIVKRNGNYDKINAMLDIFDSKNKKGKDVLFNQDYFINNVNNNIDNNKRMKVRGNSKKRLLTPNKNNAINPLHSYGNSCGSPVSKGSNNVCYSHVNTTSNYKLNKTGCSNSNFNVYCPYKSSEDICLDNRTVQRFFSYTILDLFKKYFINSNAFSGSNSNNNSNSNVHNVLRNTNYNINNKNCSYNKYSSNNNSNKLKNKRNNNNIIPLLQPQVSNSLLNHYTNRNTKLKEYAKPIIGTNDITVYNPSTNKLTRIHLNLSKEEHGYSFFPEGCRHILINKTLYITGGVDLINQPINIVLSFNIETKILSRLSNLNTPHSYHSLDYLDNYDCIILIGGEHNKTCELFDIYSEQWTKLPDLNYPRANVNIYYDGVTSDLYVLFGMKGDIVDKTNNSDVIEVLELNDIKSGWIKVDYYKSAQLNFKVNYCAVLPFTRDKLLIYGGNNPRVHKKLFALFNMSENEIIKVDKEVMEEIKLEEKKMRMADIALAKMDV